MAEYHKGLVLLCAFTDEQLEEVIDAINGRGMDTIAAVRTIRRQE